jgi:hypothetical protein
MTGLERDDPEVCECGHDVDDHEHLSAHMTEGNNPLIPCTVEGCDCSCFDVKDVP